jgi:hypothetical protein
MISKDLVDISKSLKNHAPPVKSKKRVGVIDEIRFFFPKDLEEMLIFEEVDKYVLIKPRRYLGAENFAKIASIVREAGGEYISSGKESHFRITK